MPVVPTYEPLAAVAPAPPEMETEVDDEVVNPVKCERCRLSFIRHPSIVPGDSRRWWLCPPCRSRLLGDAYSDNSRWV
jgi:hypothetical protein